MEQETKKCLNGLLWFSSNNDKTFKKAKKVLIIFNFNLISCPSSYYFYISVFITIETASWKLHFIEKLKLGPTKISKIFGPPVVWFGIFFHIGREDRLRTIGFPQEKLQFPRNSHWKWDLDNLWTDWKGSLQSWHEPRAWNPLLVQGQSDVGSTWGGDGIWLRLSLLIFFSYFSPWGNHRTELAPLTGADNWAAPLAHENPWWPRCLGWAPLWNPSTD